MVTIKIGNMACGGCAKGVRATLGKAAPGIDVHVDLGRRVVEVEVPDAAPIIVALRADHWDAAVTTG